MSQGRESVAVFVDVSELFDEGLAERLLSGERAEDVENIPGNVARELAVIAENTVQRLLKELGTDATKEFRHALREWIKLWLNRFTRAISVC